MAASNTKTQTQTVAAISNNTTVVSSNIKEEKEIPTYLPELPLIYNEQSIVLKKKKRPEEMTEQELIENANIFLGYTEPSHLIMQRDGKLRAWSYARVSTNKESQIMSIKYQQMRIADYIMKLNEKQIDEKKPLYYLAGQFYDWAISGKDMENRPSFQKMMGIVKSGDTVVMTNVSRLGRNGTQLTMYAEQMETAKVSIHFTEEIGELNIFEPGKKLLFAISAHIAEHQRTSNNERIKMALAVAKRNGHVAGTCPYGYTRENKLLVPCEKENEVIAFIRDVLSEEKLKVGELTRKVNNKGFKNRKGQTFQPNSIKNIIDKSPALQDVKVNLIKTYRDESLKDEE